MEYLVVAKSHMSILSAQAIQQFKLMTMNSDNITSVMTAAPVQPHNNDIIAEFKDVFKGDSKLEEQLHLEVDNSVSPVALPVRKTPIGLKEPLKRELDCTPCGRYRWTCMPLGISVALEEFQRRLNNALEGLNGVKPIFDDILLYGVSETDAEALRDHDTKLRALFQICRDKGITLKKEKLKLR